MLTRQHHHECPDPPPYTHTLSAMSPCTRLAKASMLSPGRRCWGGRKVTVATTAQLDSRRSWYLGAGKGCKVVMRFQSMDLCMGCGAGK